MNKTTSNPYIAQIYAKGRDYVPTPAKMGEFPKTVHGRTFETEAEYREAIADMLNGMWRLRGRPPWYNTHNTHSQHDQHLTRLPQRLAIRLDSQGQPADWHIQGSLV